MPGSRRLAVTFLDRRGLERLERLGLHANEDLKDARSRLRRPSPVASGPPGAELTVEIEKRRRVVA